MAEETTEAPAPAKKKKKGGLLKWLLILLVLGGAAGGGAFFMMGSGEVAEAEEAPGPETRGLLAFEPFLVNLADGGGSRFLKVNLQLVLASEPEAAEVEEVPVLVSQTRSAILELLSEQAATDLVTQGGKQVLREAIRAKASEQLEGREVVDVLFSEFVVQF